MQLSRKKARRLLCVLLVGLFFLPLHSDTSGLGLVRLALAETDRSDGLAMGEAVVAISLLLAFPVSALVILACSFLRIRLRKVYLGFPLLLLISFLVILIASESNTSGPFSSPAVLLQMQPAFYLLAIGAALLLQTRRPVRRTRMPKATVVGDTSLT